MRSFFLSKEFYFVQLHVIQVFSYQLTKKLEKIFKCKTLFRLAKFFKSCTDLKEKKGIIHMILMSESASFGAEIGDLSTKTYRESTEKQEIVYNWKNRGYSTILDAMMVIINHDVNT